VHIRVTGALTEAGTAELRYKLVGGAVGLTTARGDTIYLHVFRWLGLVGLVKRFGERLGPAVVAYEDKLWLFGGAARSRAVVSVALAVALVLAGILGIALAFVFVGWPRWRALVGVARLL